MIDIEDFLQWLTLHKSAANFRYDEHGREQDLGYIHACEVIEAELRYKVEEGEDVNEVVG